ncbi:MAG: hypothetical protein ROO73_00460 [Roseivirga sp.]
MISIKKSRASVRLSSLLGLGLLLLAAHCNSGSDDPDKEAETKGTEAPKGEGVLKLQLVRGNEIWLVNRGTSDVDLRNYFVTASVAEAEDQNGKEWAAATEGIKYLKEEQDLGAEEGKICAAKLLRGNAAPDPQAPPLLAPRQRVAFAVQPASTRYFVKTKIVCALMKQDQSVADSEIEVIEEKPLRVEVEIKAPIWQQHSEQCCPFHVTIKNEGTEPVDLTALAPHYTVYYRTPDHQEEHSITETSLVYVIRGQESWQKQLQSGGAVKIHCFIKRKELTETVSDASFFSVTFHLKDSTDKIVAISKKTGAGWSLGRPSQHALLQWLSSKGGSSPQK